MRFSATIISALSLAFVASASPVAKRDFSTHSGTATFYGQGSEAGSCGDYNSDDSYVVAMPGWLHKEYNCGKDISISYGGKTITAKIADTCPECQDYHIDLSKGAFGALADYNTGEINVEWHMI
jgi:rare lipoprotein A (peptidoglycan hydrolase)